MYKLFYITLLLTSSLIANNIYIVSNEKISVTKKEMQNFFSGKSNYINGKKYKRISNQESLENFAHLAFSISKEKLSQKWLKENFRNGTPFPLAIKNDKKVIKWLRNHPSTIGFVTQVDKSVHVIFTFDK